MGSNEIKLIEDEFNTSKIPITRDQMQAAYALNLCAVSVSQIIDYDDIIVLEQEYETILNNLNLEHMPKDEALLDIIKNLLETIAFFRIQDGEKRFIEKDYQQKMKNAIWNAMPNPGALISTGLSKGAVGLTVSLAASVGTAYMNYRKNRAEYQNEKEKQYWELKKAAMEQFQTLQQQLFETSWRLAEKYKFPDALRLTEKQIKQYDAILMDDDEVRKFERLDSIKHKFAAYPPFWYFFGNTANSISTSEHYGLDNNEKEYYHDYARKCFEYFSEINKYDLLREDGITASCYLEYIDFLDVKNDKELIEELLEKAVRSAGNSLDTLQLCAISYMKINAMDKAAYLLRQLVNEKYNEVTNAQLLSSIYVNQYIKTKKPEISSSYKLLGSRVNIKYLFPLSDNMRKPDPNALEEEFVEAQRKILRTKYKLVIKDFIKKYEAKINGIIPIPDALEKQVPDEIYANKLSIRQERIDQVQLVLYSGTKGDRYRAFVQNISYSYEVLEVLNKMFASVCMLECMQDEYWQLNLQEEISKGIQSIREKLQESDRKLSDFNERTYADIQDITLKKLTGDFFVDLAKRIKESVDSKTEMRDFAIAELNLIEFCKKEGIKEPELLYASKDDIAENETLSIYFTPDLIGKSTIKQNERIKKNLAMMNEINNSREDIILNVNDIEFYTQEDPRMNRYFYNQKFKGFRPKTLAVLDDRTKGDRDLLFTTEGLMPVIKGKVKKVVPYDRIKWSENTTKKELIMGVKYSNNNLEMDRLYELIKKLAVNESKDE